MSYLCHNCGFISEAVMDYRGKEPKPPNPEDGHFVSLWKTLDYWNHKVTCLVCNETRHLMVYRR
ncbi:hypothetical protein LCGC14_1661440 [marine sediment metagenome]|uniref:Uncharacterized protein n=1 Tax=marine sediment metagenome TaxID=412755 RepID=A0A0F9KTZ2_9ZZZZ